MARRYNGGQEVNNVINRECRNNWTKAPSLEDIVGMTHKEQNYTDDEFNSSLADQDREDRMTAARYIADMINLHYDINALLAPEAKAEHERMFEEFFLKWH